MECSCTIFPHSGQFWLWYHHVQQDVVWPANAAELIKFMQQKSNVLWYVMHELTETLWEFHSAYVQAIYCIPKKYTLAWILTKGIYKKFIFSFLENVFHLKTRENSLVK